jgi:hypothetical protein
VTRGWRKLHNEELHSLYLKKEKNEMEEEQKKNNNSYRILVKSQKERVHYKDLNVGGK